MRISIVFIVGLLLQLTCYAAVQTTIDKMSIESNEIFTLTLSSNDHLSMSPDLEPLKNDFYIVGTSQNSSFNFINGKASVETQWQIALMPKRTGDLQIPSLIVGKDKSNVQLIHVSAKANTNMLPVTQSSDIYLETSVTPKEAFVQEQLIYTMKLYFSRSISNGYLVPPDVPDAKVSQNGQDIIYSVTRRGRYYRVLERTYLITPEKTGQFVIQPPVLKGYLETITDKYDVYGLGSHAVKPIKVVGQTLTIVVKPKPSHFVGHWLPAKKVVIKETWDAEPPVFRAGEPTTRTVMIKAIGATAEQIPSLTTVQAAGLNSYLQTPKRETNVDNGQQIGDLTQNVVYIPTTSGQVNLPPITVRWWNSVTRREETTTLPGKKITVLPAINQASAALPIKTNVMPAQPSVSVTPHDAKVSSFSWSNLIWPAIALAAILLWLVTLLLWRKQRKQLQGRMKGVYPSVKSLSAQLKQACDHNNPIQARSLLIQWAKYFWKDDQLNSLADISRLLEQDKQKRLYQELMALEASFYSEHKVKWQGQGLWQAFSDYIATRAQPPKQDDDPLPPLYCTS